MNRIFIFYIIWLFISLPFLGFAAGDGGVLGKTHTVIYIKENTQYSVIHHFAGTQKMFISIDFDWKKSNATVWLLPVPSDPVNVSIDIPEGVPHFSGNELIETARGNLNEVLNTFLNSYYLSTILPIPMSFIINSLATGSMGDSVIVHKHIEEFGLTAEVISANEGMGIYNYLTSNGLELSEGIVPQLDKYVEMKYSFIVMWFSDSQLTIRYPAILMEFPTEDIYYPLILTSIYGNGVIPIQIIVVGYVTPKLYNEIEKYTDVSYFYQSSLEPRDPESEYDHEIESGEYFDFIREIYSLWDAKFTLIKLKTPANALKNDLWIEKKKPDKLDYAEGINNIFGSELEIPMILLLFLILSFLVGFFLGFIVFGHEKKEFPFYLMMGFGNTIGIIGLIISTLLVSHFRKYPGRKVIIFFISFIISFTLIFGLFFLILMIPL